MDNIKDNKYYIEKAKEHLVNINEYISGITEEDFLHNKMLISAVCFEHIQVYENAKMIKESILDEVIDFPLYELCSFRNRIVHEYGKVDYHIIYKSSVVDVPKLIKQLDNIKM